MRVIARDPKQTLEAGYPSLAYVPFLIHDDGTYPDVANRYLRVRALCEWKLKMGSDAAPSHTTRRFLTPQSCVALARRLATFLDWCESTARDWRTVAYHDDLIEGWQKGLLAGTAAKSGTRLSFETINGLISEACYFLTWAGETPRNLRAPFHVATNLKRVNASRGTNAKGRRTNDVHARVGALRVQPSRLILPSPSEIGPWMRAMRARYVAKALMAELILETGIRISECNQWRTDTLPPRSNWRVRDGKVPVVIRHGIKGPKIAMGSTESVHPREILVPLDLAARIDHYREITRPNQLRRWIKAGQTKEERARRARTPKPELLWLSEASHQPFANTQFYRAWTLAPGCPDGWHPHAGREFFAVEMIVDWVRKDLQTRQQGALPELSWLQGVMRDQVRLLLSPLMGHVSDDTTMLYLKAAHARLTDEFGHPALHWQMYCDMADE